MMKFFRVKIPEDEFLARVFRRPGNQGESRIVREDDWFIFYEGLGETDDFIQGEVRVELTDAPAAEWRNPDPGWIEKRFVGPEIPADQVFVSSQTLNEEIFTRLCVQTQLATGSGGDNSKHSIAAEFLIASALMLSKLEEFGTRIAGTDAIGPYQITSQDWQHFLDANAEAGPAGGLDQTHRISHYHQITAAAYLMQEYASRMIELVEAEEGGTDKDFMPTFLNLFHAWLTGKAEVALALFRVHESDDKNKSVRNLIEPMVSDFDLVAARCALVMKIDDPSVSIDAFFEKTGNDLTAALKAGFTKIKDNASDYLANASGAAPWLNNVMTEFDIWDRSPGMTETTEAGITKTVEYFRSIIPGTTAGQPTPAWCGAFASFCVGNVNAEFKASLPDTPERARNWRNWGNVSIPTTARNIPTGAVILVGPNKETDEIGHVTFFDGVLPGNEKIECIGGNQGVEGRVKKSTFPLSRVVGIRSMSSTVGEAPTEDAVVVALTLFGEARNQPDEGKQAVANVIMNRVAKQKNAYGLTPRAVCLKDCQFSCWNANDPNRARLIDPATQQTAMFQTCLGIANRAIGETLPDLTDGATHYYATYIAKPSWLVNNPQNPVLTATIGVHRFYKNVDP